MESLRCPIDDGTPLTVRLDADGPPLATVHGSSADDTTLDPFGGAAGQLELRH